jgi:hypothetical protein
MGVNMSRVLIGVLVIIPILNVGVVEEEGQFSIKILTEDEYLAELLVDYIYEYEARLFRLNEDGAKDLQYLQIENAENEIQYSLLTRVQPLFREYTRREVERGAAIATHDLQLVERILAVLNSADGLGPVTVTELELRFEWAEPLGPNGPADADEPTNEEVGAINGWE